MVNLVIDIGNSRVKLAIFKNRELILKEVMAGLDAPVIQQRIAQYGVTHSLISSVNQEIFGLEETLKSVTNYIRFSHHVNLPIHNHYQTPETLGLDRLAGLMGARHLHPQKNTLVIDAGTCITYDLINSRDEYFGGSISPGIQMRLKALHDYTGRLPLVAADLNFTDFIGTDTQTAILAGVYNGVLTEVTGVVAKYLEKTPEMGIVLCGGDANFFDTRLKNSIFAHGFSIEPDLVLIGLNEIIHHQHDQ